MKLEFDAKLLRHEGLDAAYIEPPFDVEKEFGSKRVKVRAFFDGFEYRGSIVRMDGCFMLGVTKQVRSAIGKGFGDIVHVVVEKDELERVVDVPEELSNLLKANAEADKKFSGMSYSHRKDYSLWVAGGAKPETRQSRAGKAIGLIIQGKPLK